MVNERLAAANIRAFDLRDHFQQRVVKAVARNNRLIVDIGSGSGRFLFYASKNFEHHLGIEVTAECRNFARRELELRVEEKLPSTLSTPSVVTLWHSLEHIPLEASHEMMKTLARTSDAETAIVVCIPNGDSWQARFFGTAWAYYDTPHHLHQFSLHSVTRLMAQHGFVLERTFFGFVYVLAGYLLSAANLVSPGHNDFYLRKKRGVGEGNSISGPAAGVRRVLLRLFDLALAGVMVISLVPALILTLAESVSLKRSAVLTLCFKKKL
jgi:hypothetical protein